MARLWQALWRLYCGSAASPRGTEMAWEGIFSVEWRPFGLLHALRSNKAIVLPFFLFKSLY